MMLFIYVVSIFLVSFILNDMMAVASSTVGYLFILVKWVLVLILLGLSFFTLVKIINVASSPFESTRSKTVDEKKERILSKEKLQTKSDLIMQKYTKDVK